MTREQMIAHLDRFNIAPVTQLRTWDDKRLADSVQFVKSELEKATHAK